MKTAEAGRALLMDVDGVLVLPPQMFGSALMTRHPATVRAFFAGPFLEASTGRADLRELLPPLLKQIGYAGSPDSFLNDWFESENCPNLPLLDALTELRSSGWPVFLATNQERHRLKYLLDDMNLGQVTDGEFSSASVGHRKPHPAYFAQVTAALGIPAASIVFWDDVAENVEAARTAGWTAHLYGSVQQFQQVMEATSRQTR
ncbi:HAD family phosphatase [Deinococcus sp. KNUC1210]|uniref:HAD family hydrolase n=1 Tax=Deinococcus sp. KNUC1210 TaxID=2917691 RepID=UPI001EEFCEC0|nr:HAD family phosphatase [Deinococcus sp. KNUC1210]ULH15630.1 HAD family phosphatase [Deinococcus sp. KNUC1210]